MRMSQIHRMAKPSLLSAQRFTVGLFSSPRAQCAQTGTLKLSLAGERSFWSINRGFGKSLPRLVDLREKVIAELPETAQAPDSKAKLLRPTLHAEPVELEDAQTVWVSCVC